MGLYHQVQAAVGSKSFLHFGKVVHAVLFVTMLRDTRRATFDVPTFRPSFSFQVR